MNCVRMMGGLGNQLFQYVFYKFIQNFSDYGVVISKDYYELPGGKGAIGVWNRRFLLDYYNVSYLCISGNYIPCKYRCTDSEFEYDLMVADSIYYDGFWQKYSFVKMMKSQIAEDLVLKEKYIDEKMRNVADQMNDCNSVSLHIRRTDYLFAPDAVVLSIDYYVQAIKVIKDMIGDIVLYVFSDDIPFVKENIDKFEVKSVIIMPQREAYQDNWLMQQSKHHIISNSSFSLWAAYLDQKDGITIAPSKWYSKDKDINEIYLKDWLIVK